jgi:hypothetical protein
MIDYKNPLFEVTSGSCRVFNPSVFELLLVYFGASVTDIYTRIWELRLSVTTCFGSKLADAEQRHRDRWTACTGYRQSKVLMSYLLPSRGNELLAMNKLRLRAAVGLLTGHTSLRAHLHKVGHTGRARMPTVWI